MNNLSYFKQIILHYFEAASKDEWEWNRDNESEIEQACDVVIDTLKEQDVLIRSMSAAIRQLETRVYELEKQQQPLFPVP